MVIRFPKNSSKRNLAYPIRLRPDNDLEVTWQKSGLFLKVGKCSQNDLMANKRLGFVLQMVKTVSRDQTILAVCGVHKKCEISFTQTANLYRYVVFFIIVYNCVLKILQEILLSSIEQADKGG